jgi:hypothetical protein
VVGKCLWCRGHYYDRILYTQSGVRQTIENVSGQRQRCFNAVATINKCAS